MRNSKKCGNLECVIYVLLILATFFMSVSNDEKLRRTSNKVTHGQVNTILIVVIIALLLTVDVVMGFLLAVIYMVALIRFHNGSETFISGPSPLACATYGDSKKKTGTAFYPLHA